MMVGLTTKIDNMCFLLNLFFCSLQGVVSSLVRFKSCPFITIGDRGPTRSNSFEKSRNPRSAPRRSWSYHSSDSSQ